MKGLPTRSNGLPPPLARMEIDTSHNPGRRVLRQGFVEAVGSPMWFGAPFWPLVGRRPEEVCGLPWLKCRSRGNDVIRIDVVDAPFASSEGEDAALQDRLRQAFYP